MLSKSEEFTLPEIVPALPMELLVSMPIESPPCRTRPRGTTPPPAPKRKNLFEIAKDPKTKIVVGQGLGIIGGDDRDPRKR